MLLLVTSAEYMGGHTLLCTFNNGEKKKVDLTPLLKLQAYKELEDVNEFVRYGVDGTVFGQMELTSHRNICLNTAATFNYDRKEKAALGMIYNPNRDPELQAEMQRTHALVHEYNLLSPLQEEERADMLRRLLGRCGKGATIVSPFFCDYGYNIEVGDRFFANAGLVVLDGARVRIGHNVFIAPHVVIYTAGHPLDAAERREGLEYARPVTIGDDVWIGGGVSILPGVSIGDRCVIGAGSVVNRDIPCRLARRGQPVPGDKKPPQRRCPE